MCMITDAQGRVLVQERLPKPSNPWSGLTFPGGHVEPGETVVASVIREVQEELGITLDSQNGKLLFSEARDIVAGVEFYDYMYIWLFDYDGDFSLEDASTKEVAQARWMTADEIRDMAETGTLSPPLTYFFTKVHTTKGFIK